MKTKFEARASIIIYNILMSNGFSKTFLMPANICPIVPTTFLKAQVPFEFIDIEVGTLSMDLGNAYDKIRKDPNKYGGVFFVRSYGSINSVDNAFAEIKSLNQDLIIFDDRCLCPPSFQANNRLADIELYSTGYSKYIDLGWGGYSFCNDQLKYVHKILPYLKSDEDILISSFRKFQETTKNFQYKDSDWLGSCVEIPSFEKYKTLVSSKYSNTELHKSQINEIYKKELPSEIQIGNGFNDWRFNILTKKKNRILEAVFKGGLFASDHYASISHIFGSQQCKVAEKIHKLQINLFNDFRFTTEMAFSITQIIKKEL